MPITQIFESKILLGELVTTSGASQTLSGLVLAGYKELFIVFNAVSHNSGTANAVTMQGLSISGNNLLSNYVYGIINVNLLDGIFTSALGDNSVIGTSTGAINLAKSGDCGLDNNSSSITFAWHLGASFDAGNIKVYGVK